MIIRIFLQLYCVFKNVCAIFLVECRVRRAIYKQYFQQLLLYAASSCHQIKFLYCYDLQQILRTILYFFTKLYVHDRHIGCFVHARGLFRAESSRKSSHRVIKYTLSKRISGFNQL